MVSATAGPVELCPGRWLGKYQLVQPLASGGMAEVWLARMCGPHGFEKLVALKTILPSLAQDPRFRRMFADEAKIAAGIEHVNVAHVWDLGEQGDLLYLAMEWVDGDVLQKLERAAQRATEMLPTSVVIRIMADVCAGLHAAHELCDFQGKSLNVVHRDVSPQNILISAAGVTKLIDFGVAKARPGHSEETATGTIKGKLHYMAPEQALGRPLDRRADIWAVGATLYRLLARRPLFSGMGRLSIVQRLSSPAPPEPLPASVPAALASVVHKALAFEPAHRYATAAEFGAALEDLASGPNRATSRDVAICLERYLGDSLSARRTARGLALAACAAPETTPLDSRGSLMVLDNTALSSPGSVLTAPGAESIEHALPFAESGVLASSPTYEEPTRPLGGPASRRFGKYRRRLPAGLGLLAFGGCVAWLLASSSSRPVPGPPPPLRARGTASPPAPGVAAVSANLPLVLPALVGSPPPSSPFESPERALSIAPRQSATERKSDRGARAPLPRKRGPSRVAVGANSAREVIDDGF